MSSNTGSSRNSLNDTESATTTDSDFDDPMLAVPGNAWVEPGQAMDEFDGASRRLQAICSDNRALWRALAAQLPTFPSGFDDLDATLPGDEPVARIADSVCNDGNFLRSDPSKSEGDATLQLLQGLCDVGLAARGGGLKSDKRFVNGDEEESHERALQRLVCRLGKGALELQLPCSFFPSTRSPPPPPQQQATERAEQRATASSSPVPDEWAVRLHQQHPLDAACIIGHPSLSFAALVSEWLLPAYAAPGAPPEGIAKSPEIMAVTRIVDGGPSLSCRPHRRRADTGRADEPPRKVRRQEAQEDSPRGTEAAIGAAPQLEQRAAPPATKATDSLVQWTAEAGGGPLFPKARVSASLHALVGVLEELRSLREEDLDRHRSAKHFFFSGERSPLANALAAKANAAAATLAQRLTDAQEARNELHWQLAEKRRHIQELLAQAREAVTEYGDLLRDVLPAERLVATHLWGLRRVARREAMVARLVCEAVRKIDRLAPAPMQVQQPLSS